MKRMTLALSISLVATYVGISIAGVTTVGLCYVSSMRPCPPPTASCSTTLCKNNRCPVTAEEHDARPMSVPDLAGGTDGYEEYVEKGANCFAVRECATTCLVGNVTGLPFCAGPVGNSRRFVEVMGHTPSGPVCKNRKTIETETETETVPVVE
jgi:hypothetical protein